MYKFVTIIFILNTAAVLADFPDFLTKCNFADNECFQKTSQVVLTNYFGGLPEINLIPFDPLRIKNLVLKRVPSSPVNIELKFEDLDVFGLKMARMITAKSPIFGERSHFEVKVPTLLLKGNYVIDGNVLILPIRGNGIGTITITNAIVKYSFDVKPLNANGEVFAKVEHVKLEVIPEHVEYHFENLFNGDKALGDNMNKFINENWLHIFNELQPSFSKGLSLVIKDMINKIHRAYPYDILYHKPN